MTPPSHRRAGLIFIAACVAIGVIVFLIDRSTTAIVPVATNNASMAVVPSYGSESSGYDTAPAEYDRPAEDDRLADERPVVADDPAQTADVAPSTDDAPATNVNAVGSDPSPVEANP